MLIDGLKMLDGSDIENLTIASGSAFPSVPDKAELFYLDTINGTNQIGLYYYNGTEWGLVPTLDYIGTAIQNIIGAAPDTLAAIQELANNLQNSSAITQLVDDIALKADKTYVDTVAAGKADISSLSLVATSGSYLDLIDKPIIAKKVSQLENDLTFQTLGQVASVVGTERQRAQLEENKIRADLSKEITRATNAELDLTDRINSITGTAVVAGDLSVVATSGNYNDLIDKKTKLSEFDNDVGFPTQTYIADMFASKANQTQVTSLSTAVQGLGTTVSSFTYSMSSQFGTLKDGVTLAIKNKADVSAIPKLTSQLTNDSGYQTATQVNDTISEMLGVVPDSLQSLSQLSIALQDNTDVAVALSNQFSDLSGQFTQLSTSFTNNNTLWTNSLANKAETSAIPTLISQLTNDNGYQTLDDVNNRIEDILGVKPDDLVSLGGLKTRLDTVDDEVITLNANIASVSNTLTSINSSLGKVTSDLSAASSQNATYQQTISTTVNSLEQQFDGFKSAVTTAIRGKADTSSIPSKTSQLENDSFYQTSVDVANAITSLVGPVPGQVEELTQLTGQLSDQLIAVSTLASTITSKADKSQTLSGYGIIDAYTKNEINTKIAEKVSANAIKPVATTGSFNHLTDIPTSILGYGITDAYTKTEIDNAKANKAQSLAGYGITDAYTTEEADNKFALKGTKLSDYGITDAYTSKDIDLMIKDTGGFSSKTYSFNGALSAFTGVIPWIIPFGMKLRMLKAYVNSVSTAGTVDVTINYNGTVLTTISIPQGTHQVDNMADYPLSEDGLITVNITNPGIGASDLQIIFIF